MAFFKATGDQLKANAFVSHLEFAIARIRPDLIATTSHLQTAHEQMEKIRKAHAEYIFSKEGWLYVIGMCEQLSGMMKLDGCDHLLRACFSMYEWALHNLASAGSADAQFTLGKIHVNGEDIPKDERKAIELFEQASAQGHADAQFSLGVMYANGMGIPKDGGKAAELFKKAGDQGHAAAQFNLGSMYATGEGIPKDERKGASLLEQAAAQEYAPAQFSLGMMHANGSGTAKDEHKAVEWFERSAAQGFANAQFSLGVMYANGNGIPKDARKAVEWYQGQPLRDSTMRSSISV